jgi:RimJ/RimL family protein N-acetyltransferase
VSSAPEIKTERLGLRGIERSDTEAVLRVFADPEMSRFFAADFSDRAQALEMVERRLAYAGPAGMGHWVVEFDGVVVGVAHLRPSEELSGGVPEIGYYLDRAYGGQGLATEAAAALVDHAFTVLGLPAVWALIHESNVASLNLVRRLGFLDVGSGVHYGDTHRVTVALPSAHGKPHHLELWVADITRAEASFGWLLGELGWQEYQRFSGGVSWKLGVTYLVLEQSPALTGVGYERTLPGLNHLALHVDTRARVDSLVAAAQLHGWQPMFVDRYPFAGGESHYAAYLENEDGFEIELVALDHR